MSPAATPLWKLGQLVMLGGTSMFPLFRSTIVFLGGARPGYNHRNTGINPERNPDTAPLKQRQVTQTICTMKIFETVQLSNRVARTYPDCS